MDDWHFQVPSRQPSANCQTFLWYTQLNTRKKGCALPFPNRIRFALYWGLGGSKKHSSQNCWLIENCDIFSLAFNPNMWSKIFEQFLLLFHHRKLLLEGGNGTWRRRSKNVAKVRIRWCWAAHHLNEWMLWMKGEQGPTVYIYMYRYVYIWHIFALENSLCKHWQQMP